MTSFVFQAGDFMRAEKTAVRHALFWLGDATQQETLVLSYDEVANHPHDLMGRAPVGTVEFCTLLMRRNKIKPPEAMSYPDPLRSYLGREIQLRAFSKVPDGWFIKPTSTKLFDGHLKGEGKELGSGYRIVVQNDDQVWCAPPVKFRSEFRYYILRGEITGYSRYDDGADNAPEPDRGLVEDAVRNFCIARVPVGFVLDFGVTWEGDTLLIEANDGWALGYYPWGTMKDEAYMNLILARWAEIEASGKRAGAGGAAVTIQAIEKHGAPTK